MFSTLRDETEKFREYQANLGRQGRPLAATATLTTKIVVYNPVSKSPSLRWEIAKFAMRLMWSPAAAHSVKVGAALTLLTSHAENPGSMIRSLVNDPDIEVVVLDVGEFENGVPRLERRGERGEQQMASFRRILDRAPRDPMFMNTEIDEMEIHDTGTYMIAISSVLAQVWILVAKAVTAPETAEESEVKRWTKYVQQKRVNADYMISARWVGSARSLISQDLSVRKFMVEILIEVKKSGTSKGRLNEMIADIGNYIEETGMAGFFLTIKYGLEMKFHVIVINEFQADLLTIQTLMRTYMELGPRAPYMVLLEDSMQTKFAPGNYPLLWSFAMGVGTTLDRSMGALNINRSYLEPMYFKLGQNTARKNAGSVDRKLAAELQLTDEQLDEIRDMMKEVTTQRHETSIQAREGKFNVAAGGIETLINDEDDDYTETRFLQETGRDQMRAISHGNYMPPTIKSVNIEDAEGLDNDLKEKLLRNMYDAGLHQDRYLKFKQSQDSGGNPNKIDSRAMSFASSASLLDDRSETSKPATPGASALNDLEALNN
ncbi:nucleocapsid protein [melian virus]|uniref:Nucleocapsid n=1 Tax=melian virus TaxID=2940995 RepID=A0AAE9KYI3_9MONO|nr:nucleocapsid protein [melian virus]